MKEERINAATGMALSLVIHGILGGLVCYAVSSENSSVRIPDVMMVSFADVVLHADEPAAGSSVGVETAEPEIAKAPPSVPLPSEPPAATVSKKPAQKKLARTTTSPTIQAEKPAPKISPQPESSQMMAQPRIADTAEVAGILQGAGAEFTQIRLGQGGSSRDGAGNYELLVVSHLTRAKQYPERARRRGLEGDVVLELLLNRDGSVRRAAIVENSPWEILDTEALQMVDRAAPFPVPPPNYRPGENVGFKIPIRFDLR